MVTMASLGNGTSSLQTCGIDGRPATVHSGTRRQLTFVAVS